jgi:hypothetical protein
MEYQVGQRLQNSFNKVIYSITKVYKSGKSVIAVELNASMKIPVNKLGKFKLVKIEEPVLSKIENGRPKQTGRTRGRRKTSRK